MARPIVGIVVFPDVEVLDVCGPFEVLSVVRLDEARRREEPSPFDVRLVAVEPGIVVASGGLTMVPHHVLADCPPLDTLIVPGGWGTRRLFTDEGLSAWLRERAPTVTTLASVCTGAMLLGAAGLLDGRRATTHWRSLGWMHEALPAVHVEDTLRVVEDGNVLTSAGISAGIDMALRIVEQRYGRAIAEATARHMEYPMPSDDLRSHV
ncbi:MAG TPA: DJ-1/PfpI family protein [Candidatus Binatia bacterium]|jgi:transcriptional regulator GlxA family with amidase domain|nr:DJ-1/PfpI family protein [Candidatus Binatia bacterium]